MIPPRRRRGAAIAIAALPVLCPRFAPLHAQQDVRPVPTRVHASTNAASPMACTTDGARYVAQVGRAAFMR